MNKLVFLSILVFISADIYGMVGLPENVDNDITPKNTLTKNSQHEIKKIQERSKIEQYVPKPIKNSTETRNKKEFVENLVPVTVQVIENQNSSIFRATSVSENPVEKKDQCNEDKELKEIKELLKNTHPDKILKNNEPLIISAVKEKNIDLMKLLLQHGANPNQLTQANFSLLKQLNWAIPSLFYRSNCSKLSLLLHQFDQANLSLLSIAYINKDWDIVRLLLEHGVHPDNSSMFCCSLFFISYAENRSDLMELLLQYGANPNQKGWFGDYSILIDAIQEDNIKIVKLLLKYRADPNQTDKSNETPLLIAVAENKLDMMKLLLQHGANPNQTDKDGKTPLLIAAEKRNSELVKLLLDHGGRFYLFR